MKTSALIAMSALAGLAATPASAGTIVYDVSDYSGGKHGLWTNRLDSGSARFYSFQSGTRFVIDTANGMARLVGSAINDRNTLATLDLTFTDFLESTAGTPFMYKRERGAAYDPGTDSPDIDFFSGGSGTIAVGGQSYALNASPFAGNTLFQYGPGANAKNPGEFGGSSWLSVEGQPAHWDINFALTAGAVPEPATWAMLLIGFGAIGGALRSSRRRLSWDMSPA